MEHPFILAFDPPSQTELRAGRRVRRTWPAGRLAVLAIGTSCVALAIASACRADPFDCAPESTR